MKKLNIYKVISLLSFYIILFYILFLKWAINASEVPVVLISAVLLIVLNLRKKSKDDKKNKMKLIFSIFVLIFYILINVFFTSEHQYLFKNIFNATLYPFLAALYFILLLKNDKDFLNKYIIMPSFFILNLYFIINTFIVLKQVSTPGFMIRNFTTNNYYLDQVDGLLGSNGTAKLMLFHIFLLNLNLSQFKSSIKIISKLAKVLFVLTLIGSCYISLLNDSRMYYILLILFMLPIGVTYIKNNSISIKALKKLIMIVFILGGAYLLYLNNTSLKTLIDEKFINGYFNRTVQSVGESGNEERIELFKLAIEDGDGLRLGRGIGSMPFDGEGYVKHFGLNDFNVRVYSGGIIYVVLLLFVYKNIYELILKIKKSNYLFKTYLFALLFIIGLYTQVFTYCNKNILLSLIFFSMSFIDFRKKENQ